MHFSLISVHILLIIKLAASENCKTIENTETKAYTYHVCNVQGFREFNDARTYCKESFKDSDLVTFPNEEEYKFLIGKLSDSESDDFRFYPGIYQKAKEDRYNPETGKLFWVTDPQTIITPQSATYWQPFSRWIEEFDSLSLQFKQYEYFHMDKKGLVYMAVKYRGKLPADKPDPSVVCMASGITPTVTEKATLPTKQGPNSSRSTQAASIDIWIIVVIAVAAVALLVLLGVAVGCYVTSKRDKFHKVPQTEQPEVNA